MGSAEDEQQESESQFKVTDRRKFTLEGEIRSSVSQRGLKGVVEKLGGNQGS